MLKSERREFMKITAIYQLAAQNAGSRAAPESASMRPSLRWTVVLNRKTATTLRAVSITRPAIASFRVRQCPSLMSEIHLQEYLLRRCVCLPHSGPFRKRT